MVTDCCLALLKIHRDPYFLLAAFVRFCLRLRLWTALLVLIWRLVAESVAVGVVIFDLILGHLSLGLQLDSRLYLLLLLPESHLLFNFANRS